MGFPTQQPSDSQGCHMVYLSEKPPSGTPEMLSEYPDLLTVQHVAGITGLSEQTIRGEINAGKLPGCRIGRRLFVPKPAFVKYANGGASDEQTR